MITKEKLIAQYLSRLYFKNLTTCYGGNISIRDIDSYLISETGVDKSIIEDTNVARMSYNDVNLNHVPQSSEYQIHRMIYQIRPDINSIVHAHPPYVTAFALANENLDSRISSEMFKNLGTIVMAEYAKPGSTELAEIVANSARISDSIIMANHGVIVLAENIHQAYYMMELIEQLAHMTFLIKTIGGGQVISDIQLGLLGGI